MNKTVFLIPLLFSVMSLAHTEESEQSPASSQSAKPEPTISIYTRPQIVGLWGMDIPKNKSCVEYYNFGRGNEVVINSAEEWSVGQFDYQPSTENAPLAVGTLMLQVNYENNQTDCSGNKVDQSGELSQYFVKWNSPNQINFCANEQGKDCFATLKRVLP